MSLDVHDEAADEPVDDGDVGSFPGPYDAAQGEPGVDFGSRWSAFIIDALILFTVQWVMFMVLARTLQAAGMTSDELCVPDGTVQCTGPSTLLWVILVATLVATTLAYHAVFEGLWGATPGKRWMGLAVERDDGTNPVGLVAGVQRSFVRQLFWISLLFVLDVSPFDLGLPAIVEVAVPLAAIALMGIGAFDRSGRAVHDRVARTRVVRTQARVAPAVAQPAEREVAPDRSIPLFFEDVDPQDEDITNDRE